MEGLLQPVGNAEPSPSYMHLAGDLVTSVLFCKPEIAHGHSITKTDSMLVSYFWFVCLFVLTKVLLKNSSEEIKTISSTNGAGKAEILV